MHGSVLLAAPASSCLTVAERRQTGGGHTEEIQEPGGAVVAESPQIAGGHTHYKRYFCIRVVAESPQIAGGHTPSTC